MNGKLLRVVFKATHRCYTKLPTISNVFSINNIFTWWRQLTC